MVKKRSRYYLCVRPGILKDGTFGIYAIPENNSSVEYQLDGQFQDIAEAQEMAEAYLSYGKEYFFKEGIRVQQTREVELASSVSKLIDKKHEAALANHLKSLMQMPKFNRIRPFARITESTPYWLSIATLVVFFFSISVTVPNWVPVLGDWIGGKSFGSEKFAVFFPFVMLALTIYLQMRARFIGLKLSAMRDHVLSLALQHEWRRDRFTEFFLDVMESTGLGWARKIGEWMQRWDPDTLRQVREDAERSQHRTEGDTDFRESYAELEERLLAEDFEARIHSLYYMDKEYKYRDWDVVVYPLFFLMNHRRAVRRMRLIITNGLQSLLYLVLCSLPGGYDYRIRRRLFPFLALSPILIIGTPLVWSFVQKPWPTFLGWIGMILLTLASIIPILVWNYNLFTRCQGLPRGMSWEDMQGDSKFIRGL